MTSDNRQEMTSKGSQDMISEDKKDMISEETVVLNLDGVKAVFPGAPKEVYNRPSGSIDVLIGSMYMDIQPYGGDEGFTRGRLRLLKSQFGCGYILTVSILPSRNER